MQDFRRLLVWARAHAFAPTIHQITRRFRGSGHSELETQLVRAADSIVSNIVEGCGAATNKEFARFLDISIKSASEADYRLELANDRGLITESEWRTRSAEVVEIRKMTYGLRRTVLARNTPHKPRGGKPDAGSSDA